MDDTSTSDTRAFIGEMLSGKPSSPSPSAARQDTGSGAAFSPAAVAHDAAREAALTHQARADAVAEANAALEVQRVLAEARHAAEPAQQPYYGAPQYGQPMAPDEVIRQAVRQELDPYISTMNDSVGAANEAILVRSLNQAESAARAKHGDEAVDAAIAMATEQGVGRAYCLQHGTNAYERLLADYAEVELSRMGSTRDFVRGMFDRRKR